MPRHACHLCGQISFTTYHEYEKHRGDIHNMKTAIKPENITGLTTKQIVDDAEHTWLKPHLILNDAPLMVTASNDAHLDACRCNNCFNKKLDALIASQEESLKNQGGL